MTEQDVEELHVGMVDAWHLYWQAERRCDVRAMKSRYTAFVRAQDRWLKAAARYNLARYTVCTRQGAESQVSLE